MINRKINEYKLPSMGVAESKPLSSDVIKKSHWADGNTNDTIVIPMAVFAYIKPHTVKSKKWNFPNPKTIFLFKTLSKTDMYVHI